MRVREYRPSDLPHIVALHKKQGFGYTLPSVEVGMAAVFVLVDEFDIPKRVLMARNTVELYLVGDDEFETPMWRHVGMLKLWETMRRALLRKGLDDCNLWLPPELEKTFKRRLKRAGFGKNLWSCFTRKLEG